jgi:hypothetical protein
VHLDGDPNVVLPGQRVDLLPELDRDTPLVVEHVHVDAVPRVHDPGGVLRVRIGAGRAGHGDDVLDAEQARELDGAAQVVGVLGPDAGQRVERIAVAVEAGELHPAVAEGR